MPPVLDGLGVDPPFPRLLRLAAQARRLPSWLRYGGTVVLVAAASGAGWTLFGAGEPHALFLLLLPVLLAGLMFNRLAGLLAAGLAVAVADLLFMPPVGRVWVDDPGDLAAAGLFLAAALLGAWLVEALHRLTLRLAASEARWRAVAEVLPGFIWTARPDGTVDWISAGGRRLLGPEPATGRGAGWLAWLHPEDEARAVEGWRRAIGLGFGQHEDEVRLRLASGTHRWFVVRSTLVRGPDGRPERWVGLCADIDDHRRAEAARAEGEARFRAMADGIPQLAWMAGPDGRMFWWNRRWFDYTGTTPAEMARMGRPGPLLHPAHAAAVFESWGRAVATGEPWESTFPMRSASGQYRWFLSRAAPVRDREGSVVLWFGTNTDVTAAREAEERRALLVAELNHRVKNTLATVQSLARQTGRSAPSVAEFLPAFEARLLALASAHDLLTREDWTGATLADLARGALAPHLASGRLTLDGPAGLRVGPRAAVALAMALGELASNAARHGALSVPGGRVAVAWRATANAPEAEGGGGGATALLLWREEGGPALPEAPPVRRGFGMRLLLQGLRGDLGAAAELDLDPAGLRCTLRIPVLAPGESLPGGGAVAGTGSPGGGP